MSFVFFPVHTTITPVAKGSRVPACKVNGKRAYDLAREGKEVELKPKLLVIDEIELLEVLDNHQIVIRVVCSKGTYIRALARDIGKALQSGGHLTALRRTRVGDVRVEDCQSVDDLEAFIASLFAENSN